MMTIPVYKSEIDAGLLDSIKSQASVAFLSELKLAEPTEAQKEVSHKAISSIPQLVNLTKDHWDLHYLNSILASVGWNENDDVFDAGEIWLARNSPVYKQVNFMHNEKDIIGNIIASIAVDRDGNIIPDNTELTPEIYDIVVASVLYKKWDDPQLQERMDSIIEGTTKGEWFVSMECLFRNFDYAIITPSGEHKVIARNASTAWLTKHLRIYGGAGGYQGNKIGRLLRNFTFSGKGIVNNPANKRSFILTDNVNPFSAKSSTLSNEVINEEPTMADNNESLLQNLRDELAKATARSEKLETKLAEMVEEARANEQKKLEKEIASLKVDVEDLNKKIVTQAADIDAKDKTVADLQKQLKESADNLVEANKKLEASKLAEIKSSRISKLVAAGLDSAEAEKMADKWASASDEQFDDVVALCKKDEAEAAKDKDDKAKDKKKEDEKVGDMDSAEADADVAGAINNEDTDDELIQSIANIFGGLLHGNTKDEE